MSLTPRSVCRFWKNSLNISTRGKNRGTGSPESISRFSAFLNPTEAVMNERGYKGRRGYSGSEKTTSISAGASTGVPLSTAGSHPGMLFTRRIASCSRSASTRRRTLIGPMVPSAFTRKDRWTTPYTPRFWAVAGYTRFFSIYWARASDPPGKEGAVAALAEMATAAAAAARICFIAL